MIDLRYLREHLDEVKLNIKNRFMSADADLVARLYDEKLSLIKELEEKRRLRNRNAETMKTNLDAAARERHVTEGKALKEEITKLERALDDTETRLMTEARKIPNLAHPDAPLGRDDGSNVEIKRVGTPGPASPLLTDDHVKLGEKLDLIDFERATKVSGPKFYYLKNEAVILEQALIRYACDILRARGFTLMQTPDVAKEEIVEGIGFNPRGEESNIYSLEGTGTCLVGTAEITLGGYYSNEMINLTDGPILLAGISHCFRREAGSAGQFSKGLYRVHQFTKVEMFALCAQEESDALHERLLSIEEEIFSGLDLAFRVVDTCVGDLGAPAYRKYDLEAWMPGRSDAGDWGEITSASNCTDFQSRRLNIRYKDRDGISKYAHTLNGTAIAISRALVAIIENNIQENGVVLMPKNLIPYLGFDRIPSRK